MGTASSVSSMVVRCCVAEGGVSATAGVEGVRASPAEGTHRI